MQILSVSLKNFKSHSDRQFTFEPGINAISGENGAGKTSILEAIAWVLFDHTPYTLEEMVRVGSSSSQVMVAFVSKRDGRTYEVHRCTSQGYKIFDPQLKVRLAHERKSDVRRWLCEQLEISAGTQLDDLFANTIGVPQGTFTADFLKRPVDRKKVFDSILKVEEYRKLYIALKPLEDYAAAQVAELEQQIQHCDSQLALWEETQAAHQETATDLQRLQQEFSQAQQAIGQLRAEKQALDRVEQHLRALREQAQDLKGRQTAQEHLRARLDQDVQAAEQAAQQCERYQAAYQTYLEAEQALQTLEQARAQRQSLLDQRSRQLETIAQQQRQLDSLNAHLERLSQYAQEHNGLLSAVEQQLGLEAAQQKLNEQLQECQAQRRDWQTQQTRASQLGVRHQELETRISQLQNLQVSIDQIPGLEQQQQRLQQQLSRVEAARQFEADLRRIADHGWEQLQTQQTRVVAVQPQLSRPALAVLTAATDLTHAVLDDLEGILDDLATQTSASTLKQQLCEIESQLKQVRSAQAQWLGLASLSAERTRLSAEQTELQHSLTALQAQWAVEPELQQQLTGLAAQLHELQDPRSRAQLLRRELQQQPALEQQRLALQLKAQPLRTQLAHLDTHLAVFGDLEAQVLAQQQVRDQSRPAYQAVLAQQNLARSLSAKQQERAAVTQTLTQLQQDYSQIVEQGTALRATHDPERLKQVTDAYEAASKQEARLSEKIPFQQQRLAQLAAQLASLEAVRLEREQARLSLKERERLNRFIRFVRKVYKSAGPRITERYLQAISEEADRLFRDLLNRQDVALRWDREYDVWVQEGANQRRFLNLSGGEQMCAALAVRLALLKVLADLDVAFFDEPTTNLDAQRREHLAEAITGIRNFRQLFVISHDDTFEKVTENVILVQRED